MLLLVGPSASGKTTIGKMLEEKYQLKKVVTYTTRPKRENEVEGIDYYFLSKEEFIDKQTHQFFFETTSYNGNLYGTSKESLTDDSYLILDPQGLMTYQNSKILNVSFFLECDKQTRIKRMQERGETEEEIQKRITLDEQKFSIAQVSSANFFVDVTKDSLAMLTKRIYLVYKSEMQNLK